MLALIMLGPHCIGNWTGSFDPSKINILELKVQVHYTQIFLFLPKLNLPPFEAYNFKKPILKNNELVADY
jgi:hypothetical protein